MSTAIIRAEDGRRTCTVDDWHLEIGDDGEPRVRDVHLATRLGYDRPRKVRELIERMVADGEIADVSPRATVARGLRRGNSVAEQTVTEFWLTEEQALLVAVRSATPKAMEVRRDLVRVYIAVRRGVLVVPASPPVPTLTAADVQALVREELARALAPLSERALSGGVIGRGAAGRLRGLLREVADLYTGESRKSQAWKSRLKIADNDVRKACSFPVRAWSMLPLESEAAATAKLDDLLRVAREVQNARSSWFADRQRQGQLFNNGGN